MKKFCFAIFILIAGAYSFQSCEGMISDFGEVEFVGDNQAIVKINMASAYDDDRSMYVKFNNVRVTPPIQGRYPYPGGGYNTRGSSRPEFLLIDGGSTDVKICLPKKEDDGQDSLVLYSGKVDFVAGKRYTLHIADTAERTKMFTTEEVFSMPDSAYATYRFINLMPNVEAVDFYYGYYSTSSTGQDASQDSLVAANVKFGEISPYITLHRGATKTFKIRPAGAAVENGTVLAFYANANTTLNQRQYTGYAMGYMGQTKASTKPYISFFLVR